MSKGKKGEKGTFSPKKGTWNCQGHDTINKPTPLDSATQPDTRLIERTSALPREHAAINKPTPLGSATQSDTRLIKRTLALPREHATINKSTSLGSATQPDT
jgi:hypothetical protein